MPAHVRIRTPGPAALQCAEMEFGWRNRNLGRVLEGSVDSGSNEGCSVHTPRKEHLLWKVESCTTRSVTEPVPHANEDSLQTREPAELTRQLAG